MELTETLIEDPSIRTPTEGRVLVIEYTDPISIWCWGMEPTIRRLEARYADRVDVEVRMGGLFEEFGPMREYWTRMSGGRWKESVRAFMDAVASQHRMPMDVGGLLGSMDDFTSTWPACLATKAAEVQGRAPGRRYLRRLREAGLLEGRPIHHREVQVDLATELNLDPARFHGSLEDGTAEEAFQADLKECRDRGITGFPTILCVRGPKTLRVDGWVPWDVFDSRLRELDSDMEPSRLDITEASVQRVLARDGRCATREVAAVLGVPDDEAEILLDDLAVDGKIVRTEVGTGLVWEHSRDAKASKRRASRRTTSG